jgi:hypothetical protein
MMRTYTVKYQEVKYTKTKTESCSICGKKCTRTISASETINPFNKNPDGTVKSPKEVGQSVSEKLKRELEKPIFHDKCKYPPRPSYYETEKD